MFDWFESLKQRDIDWLIGQGVAPIDIVRPFPIGVGVVAFIDEHCFTPIPDDPDDPQERQRVFLFPVEDGGRTIDVAAWSPHNRQLGTYYGAGFCLNQGAVFNPASFALGAALPVRRDPLDWLRVGRDGIVILRPDLAYSYLASVPRLRFSDVEFAKQVRTWIQPPKPKVELLVEQPMRKDAA